MSLDTHVQVNLTINNSGVSLAGFGLIAALTYSSVMGSDRFRLYSRASAAVTDGFAADSPEVLFINKVMGQSRHPIQVALIKGDLPPTMKYELNATARNSHDYDIQVEGEGVTSTAISHTSDASATKAEIHNGLVTALNAVVGKNFTAAFAALVVPDFTFTADAGTDQLTAAAHGLQTGDGPLQVSNSGGGLPGGLAALTDYYVIRVDANTFKLATSLANALAGTAIDVTTNGTGIQTASDTVSTKSPTLAFTVTGDAPGEWFSLEIADSTAIANKQTHVDPGVATDLTAARVANSTWYYLHTFYNSDDYAKAAAAWAQANGVMYYFDSQNSEGENTATGNSEVFDDIAALGYSRVVPCYYTSPHHMHSAGWMAILASYNPGKWSPAYKTVVGSVAKSFTDTQIANLDARKTSYYKREAGRSITWEGKLGNAEYAYSDITTGLDWFLDALKKRCFGVYVSLPKVGLVDEDVSKIKAAAEGVIDLGKSDAYDIIAPGTPGDDSDPVPTIFFPRVKDMSAEDRAARRITGGLITFRLQSASHSVIFDVTVSF